MLFKNPRTVCRDLNQIWKFPLLSCIPKIIPKDIAYKICFMGGTLSPNNIIMNLTHWHQYGIGHTHGNCRRTVKNEEIVNAIEILNNIPDRTYLVGTVLLSAYAKATEFMNDTKKVSFDCKDEEWEPLLKRIVREFSPKDVEKKLVIRKSFYGKIIMYTPNHRYSIDAYTHSNRTWKYLMNIPLAIIRISHDSEKVKLMTNLIKSSLKHYPHESHQIHQTGRLAEYEEISFQRLMKCINKVKRSKTVGFRKLFRKTLTSTVVINHLMKRNSHLSCKETIEGSWVRDIYGLNPIKNAKFPKDLLRTMFVRCRNMDISSRLIRETYNFLKAISRQEITISNIPLHYLTPKAYDLFHDITKTEYVQFDRKQTRALIDNNVDLLVHLIQKKKEHVLNENGLRFEDCHNGFSKALMYLTGEACKSHHERSHRIQDIKKTKSLLNFYYNFTRSRMNVMKEMLSIRE